MAVVGSSVEPRGIHTVQSNMPLCVNTQQTNEEKLSWQPCFVYNPCGGIRPSFVRFAIVQGEQTIDTNAIP